ncbi:cyclic GMP-AMP synthase-like isoform X2 [Branchiostoma lanceolatum]|uniref:cyclic GMP-AMP synthase-like isoform X2 n=1 Tax=Branchiostoma lanceolatum TaxID=7740 RepID=UPI003456155E
MPRCGLKKTPAGGAIWKSGLPAGYRKHPSQTAREEESSKETARTPSEKTKSPKTEERHSEGNSEKTYGPVGEKYLSGGAEDESKAVVKETSDAETENDKIRDSQNPKDEETDSGDRRRGSSRSSSARSQRNTNTASMCKPNKQAIRRSAEQCLRIGLQKAMSNVVRISQEDRSDTSKIYNPIIDGIAEEIKKAAKNEGESDIFQFQRLNSGSYFERLKVDTTDEYDIMFCIYGKVVEDLELAEMEPSLGMVAVKLPENNKSSFRNYATPDGFLSPQTLLNRFRGLVEEAVSTLKRAEAGSPFKGLDVELEEQKDGCPAVTLIVSKEEIQISIDLVLALELPKPWPQCTKGWEGCVKHWLTQSEIRAVRRTALHAVAKSAPDDPAGVLWRLSFSQTEKDLFTGHILNPTDNGNHATTCRKDCLRCMKYIKLQSMLLEVIGPDCGFASYHLKTVLLHAIANRPDGWEKENLVTCLVYVIDELVSFIDERHLPHFFIPEYNLFNPAVFKGQEHLDIVKEQYLRVRRQLIQGRLPQTLNVPLRRSSTRGTKQT